MHGIETSTSAEASLTIGIFWAPSTVMKTKYPKSKQHTFTCSRSSRCGRHYRRTFRYIMIHYESLWYIQDLGTCCIMLSWFCVAMCLTFLEFSRAASLKHGTECSAGLSWRLTHTSQTAGSRLAAPAFTMCCKSSSTHVTCAKGCAPKIRKKIPRTSEDRQPWSDKSCARMCPVYNLFKTNRTKKSPESLKKKCFQLNRLW